MSATQDGVVQPDASATEDVLERPDYDVHVKHTGPDEVTAVIWIMGRRYQGVLRCES